jgi:hypothetical protein
MDRFRNWQWEHGAEIEAYITRSVLDPKNEVNACCMSYVAGTDVTFSVF